MAQNDHFGQNDLFRTGFWYREGQNGPKWSNSVHFGLKEVFFGPLFLTGCFPGDFQEGNGPLRHSGKRPIKVGNRPIKEGKRAINANGQLSGTPPSKKAHCLAVGAYASWLLSPNRIMRNHAESCEIMADHANHSA